MCVLTRWVLEIPKVSRIKEFSNRRIIHLSLNVILLDEFTRCIVMYYHRWESTRLCAS